MAVDTGTLLFRMQKEKCMTDVTFVIQGTEVKAHRNVVFGRVGNNIKGLEEKEDRIEIDRMTLTTFNTVLEYLYTTEVKVTDANFFDLMQAAVEFKLACLESKCSEFLQEKITIKNFYSHAKEAVSFGGKEYIKMVQEYFGRNTSVLLKEETGVFGCPQDVLRVLCGSQEICCSELELFLGCVEWAKRECQKQKREESPENLRESLGDVFDKIRFSMIDLLDFQKAVVPLQILTNEEIGGIMVAKVSETVSGLKCQNEAAQSENKASEGNDIRPVQSLPKENKEQSENKAREENDIVERLCDANETTRLVDIASGGNDEIQSLQKETEDQPDDEVKKGNDIVKSRTPQITNQNVHQVHPLPYFQVFPTPAHQYISIHQQHSFNTSAILLRGSHVANRLSWKRFARPVNRPAQVAISKQITHPDQSYCSKKTAQPAQSSNSQKTMRRKQSATSNKTAQPAQSSQKTMQPKQSASSNKTAQPAQSSSAQKTVRPKQSSSSNKTAQPAQSSSAQKTVRPKQSCSSSRGRGRRR